MKEIIVKDNALINASYNLDLVEERLNLIQNLLDRIKSYLIENTTGHIAPLPHDLSKNDMVKG